MASYLSLPNEVILLIARGLPTKNLSHLTRTNRRHYELLKADLYRYASFSHLLDGALFCAAATGNEFLIRTILSNRHELLTIKNRAGDVLHQCPGKEIDEEKLQEILAEGANIIIDNSHRQHPSLHWACRKGKLSLLQIFLEAGADPMFQDGTGRTPLFLVECAEAARLLISHGADPIALSNSQYVSTPLDSALQLRKWDIVKTMLAVVPPHHRLKNGKTPLHLAAELGDDTLAASLLAAGADPTVPDDNRNTPLHFSVTHKNPTLVHHLLTHGADPTARNKHYQTPIIVAHRRPFPPVLRLLLRHARTDYTTRQRRTLLHLAIEPKNFHQPPPPSVLDEEDIALVTSLLDRGVNINARDSTGRTALTLCVQYGCAALVTLLLARGADPNIGDLTACAALHVAVQPWSSGVVGALLDGGADINAKDVDGRTVLHLAAMKDMDVLLRLFLERGADIAARDHRGQTALHIAAVYDGKRAMKVLLDAGADREAMDMNGRKVPENMLKTCSEVINGLSFGMNTIRFNYQRPF